MRNGYRQHAGLAFSAPFILSSLAAAGDLNTSEMPPAIVGSFTRAIQPLLLNRCAAGACHGGTQGAEPKIMRGPVHGRVNRKTTLMNLESVTSSFMHTTEDTMTLAAILNHHDKRKNKPAKNKPLLTEYEQELLVAWLALLPYNRLSEPAAVQSIPDHQKQTVTPANFTQQQHQRSLNNQPNRLQRLLEQAKNPPQLAPPPVTPGLQLEQLTPEEFPLLQLPFKEIKDAENTNE